MWKRKLSQRAPAHYIVSAFGIQRVVKHTSKQGAVGAGAKNGKGAPATFLSGIVQYWTVNYPGLADHRVWNLRVSWAASEKKEIWHISFTTTIIGTIMIRQVTIDPGLMVVTL
jgi:hypothetical protein